MTEDFISQIPKDKLKEMLEQLMLIGSTEQSAVILLGIVMVDARLRTIEKMLEQKL